MNNNIKYTNTFMLSGHLSASLTNSGNCLFGSIYHRIDGKPVTMAKFKCFKEVIKKVTDIKAHSLVGIKGVFAPVSGYTDKKGVYHHPEMILVVQDIKLLEQPKTEEQIAAENAAKAKELAAKEAELAAKAAELEALLAAARNGVTVSPQQNTVVEAQPEKVVLQPVAPEEVGPLVNFEGTETATSEPEVMEDINPAELLPPPGFEEHVAVNAEMQQAVVAPQPQVVKTTQTKKGLPALPSFNEIPAGIFNVKMGTKSTAVKAEENNSVEFDQPTEYKKECPFA